MKKVSLFTGINEMDAALYILRKLGVVHVKSKTTSSNDTAVYEDKIARVDKALSRIGKVEKPKTLEKTPEEVIEDIFELDEEREELLLQNEEIEAKLNIFRKWSNVSLQSILNLRESGVFVKLYSCRKKQYDNEDEEREDLYRLGESGEDVLLAHITTEKGETLDFKEEFLPAERRRDLLDDHYKTDERLAVLRSKLDFLGNYENVLKQYRKEMMDELHFARVEAGMGTTEELCYLQGFVPYDKLEDVRNAAEDYSWAYIFEDAAEEDEPPTLIRNPKWVSIIEPLLKFLGTIPGYGEIDISLWFLLFFSLFFAMLIGDAGYGLIFMAITFIAQLKFKQVPKKAFILMYLLCICTVVWGVLSGNYFGSSTLGANPFLRRFVIEEIASFRADGVVSDSEESLQFMMKMCFIIGGVHLTIAHLTSAWKKINTLRCIADFGWVGIIWGLYMLVCFLIFNDPISWTLVLCMVLGGLFLALMFDNYHGDNVKNVKDFLRQVFLGMKEVGLQIVLGVISGFSDIISYVRLFAVGYTAVVLANTFNGMAAQATDVHCIKWRALGIFVAAIVLFLGHGLNLLLSVLGVAVHGIRLNLLEFSGHIGNEWTGNEYDPFKEPN